MMEKSNCVAIDKAKGVFFFSDILDNEPLAKYMVLNHYAKNEDGSKETWVYIIQDSAKDPIFVLKSLSVSTRYMKRIKQAREEFNTAKKLGDVHPNIAKAIRIKEYTTKDKHAIEMLFEHGGENLLDQLKKGEITGKTILEIASQTAGAMEYAHKNGIFHSDLKLENIVMKNGIAKIIDFGVAIDLKDELSKYTSKMAGHIIGYTPGYCPPEILNVDQIKEQKGFNSEKIDVYLWGMVFYHLFSKKGIDDLFDEWEGYRKNNETYHKFKEMVKKLRVEGLTEEIQREFVQLISVCLSYSPVDRPSFEEINKYWLGKLKPQNFTNRFTKLTAAVTNEELKETVNTDLVAQKVNEIEDEDIDTNNKYYKQIMHGEDSELYLRKKNITVSYNNRQQKAKLQGRSCYIRCTKEDLNHNRTRSRQSTIQRKETCRDVHDRREGGYGALQKPQAQLLYS
eukprot:TRINITY_DN3981_c0_g1_i1.p1 TRINITY_DN3981_c0_g1~~TRINITY_DN3981_c0_g1_i1.p1  ORF type:complete len:479 (-),score=56.41 TRINITY_DN3981_c0_g1_i1:669-2027(-)